MSCPSLAFVVSCQSIFVIVMSQRVLSCLLLSDRILDLEQAHEALSKKVKVYREQVRVIDSSLNPHPNSNSGNVFSSCPWCLVLFSSTLAHVFVLKYVVLSLVLYLYCLLSLSYPFSHLLVLSSLVLSLFLPYRFLRQSHQTCRSRYETISIGMFSNDLSYFRLVFWSCFISI